MESHIRKRLIKLTTLKLKITFMLSIRHHKMCLKSHNLGEMIAMYNTKKGLVLQDNK